MLFTPGVVHSFTKIVGVLDFCPLPRKRILHSYLKRTAATVGVLEGDNEIR